MTAPPLLGAVLAGGQSRRFGRDKSAEIIAGRSLVARAAETLGQVFAQVVVISSSEPTSPDWSWVPDLRQGLGPLAALETALAHAEELGLDGAFVLACDLPLVDAETVRAVVRARGVAPAAAPEPDGARGIEPLCGVYDLTCLAAVTDALDRGRLAVHRVFESVGGTTVPLDRHLFLNVNSPEDRDRAAAVLERGSP